ncbi:hypothetical protein CK203_080959 [Vitis vinifera]|uniref:Reverse transcriptase zinc-binding domain-containing protein n=1 Tax=Vitis vinifera TaxID=29760 RepID=A0A438EMT8_VITVI|nr:hypothetical protein CK203_080959 [Vitis vinifera]
MLRDSRISSEEDSMLWKGGGHGTFRIRDAYKLLATPSAIAFPKKCIWVDKVPTKVAFFAWEATWEKILTLDRLQKRGGQGPLGDRLCLVWGSMGVSRDRQRGVIWLEGPFCGEKEEKDLELHPVVYFLDGMEGKK